MSGNPPVVIIAGDANGAISRVVSAAARLASIELGRYALVGGLAVTCRLATAHRVTQDIDTVTETTDPAAIDIIIGTVGKRDPGEPHRITIDGINIDVIDTLSVNDHDLAGIDATNRLFLVAHRWALDTAELTTIAVQGMEQTAAVPLATPAALIGAKTHALATRRDARADKRGSDTYDIYRLLDAHDRQGQLTETLAAAPHGLGRLVAQHLRQLLVDDAERAVRWLVQGTPEMRAMTAAGLRAVAMPFCDGLQ